MLLPGAISSRSREHRMGTHGDPSHGHAGSPSHVLHFVLGSGVVAPACHTGCRHFGSLTDQPVKIFLRRNSPFPRSRKGRAGRPCMLPSRDRAHPSPAFPLSSPSPHGLYEYFADCIREPLTPIKTARVGAGGNGPGVCWECFS